MFSSTETPSTSSRTGSVTGRFVQAVKARVNRPSKKAVVSVNENTSAPVQHASLGKKIKRRFTKAPKASSPIVHRTQCTAVYHGIHASMMIASVILPPPPPRTPAHAATDGIHRPATMSSLATARTSLPSPVAPLQATEKASLPYRAIRVRCGETSIAICQQPKTGGLLPPPPPPPPSAFLQAAPERASSLATDSADSSSESGASSTSSMTNTSAPAVHLVPSVPRLRHCRPLAARPIVATVPVPRSPSYITMKEALARTQRALQAAEQERDELLACVRELEAERSWSASESYDSCLNLKVMVGGKMVSFYSSSELVDRDDLVRRYP